MQQALKSSESKIESLAKNLDDEQYKERVTVLNVGGEICKHFILSLGRLITLIHNHQKHRTSMTVCSLTAGARILTLSPLCDSFQSHGSNLGILIYYTKSLHNIGIYIAISFSFPLGRTPSPSSCALATNPTWLSNTRHTLLRFVLHCVDFLFFKSTIFIRSSKIWSRVFRPSRTDTSLAGALSVKH